MKQFKRQNKCQRQTEEIIPKVKTPDSQFNLQLIGVSRQEKIFWTPRDKSLFIICLS